ncbi:hypothetical protein ACFQZZ_01795 [Nocardia sp. GCM10030253]|uniref:hypothetical protein n=1 Tax=Nocardia sp. GCM10030253 TaxID=3273404 RepID=UPI0036376A43
MTGWQWILLVLVAVAVTAGGALVATSVLSERRDEPIPYESRDRLDRETFCSLGWPAVDVPPWDAAEAFSIDEAHTLMRAHRDCRLESCPWKRVAFQNLVAAGRIKPDLRSERYAR